MKRFVVSVVVLMVISGLAYSYNKPDTAPVSQANITIPVPNAAAAGHDHQAMMAAARAQDDYAPAPAQHQPSPGSGCSRPDPKDPDKGVEQDTVGCNCVRKLPCNNGRPQEDPGDPADGGKTRCHNWCYPDRCACPNPCKN